MSQIFVIGFFRLIMPLLVSVLSVNRSVLALSRTWQEWTAAIPATIACQRRTSWKAFEIFAGKPFRI